MTPEQRDRLCHLAGVHPSVSNKILGDALVEAVDEMAEHVGPEEFRRRIQASMARQQAQQAQQASQTPAPGAQGVGARTPREGGDPRPGPGSDVIAWAVETGRISAERASWWTEAADEERRRTGSADSVEATLHSLAPVYADHELWGEEASDALWIVDKATGHTVLNQRRAREVQSTSATPLLDSMERELFGASREEREAAEDRAAEAQLAAQLEEERAEKARNQARAQLVRDHQQQQARTAAKLDRLEPGMTPAEERKLFGPGQEA